MKTMGKADANGKSGGFQPLLGNGAPLCLPEGALELMVALNTPNPEWGWGIPVLLWGSPGSGKTSFVKALAGDDFPVQTLIASLHDPTDFNGIPCVRGERMAFLPPEWVDVFEKSGQGILFLDELSTAPPAVQNALLRLVLEKRVGGYQLPEGVRIVAAANPVEQTTGGWEPSPALANRFVHIHWKMNAHTYAQALRYGFGGLSLSDLKIDPHHHQECLKQWRHMLSDFLQQNPHYYELSPERGEYAYPTARSWDYALRLIASCQLLQLWTGPEKGRPTSLTIGVAHRLMQGTVGIAATIAFLHFVKASKIPVPEYLLDGKETFPSDLTQDELTLAFEGMIRLLKRATIGSHTFEDRLNNFLKIIVNVVERGRGDVIFPQLHDLVVSGWLREAVSIRHLELLRRVGEYFESFGEIAGQIAKSSEEEPMRRAFKGFGRL